MGAKNGPFWQVFRPPGGPENGVFGGTGVGWVPGPPGGPRTPPRTPKKGPPGALFGGVPKIGVFWPFLAIFGIFPRNPKSEGVDPLIEILKIGMARPRAIAARDRRSRAANSPDPTLDA